MKNTCVVDVNEGRCAHFHGRNKGSTADVDSWPSALRRKFSGAGTYSISRVKKSTPRAARVVIIGAYDPWDGIPAWFEDGDYGLCARFADELGITPPPKGKRKTIYLVVTKRRSK